MIEVKNVKKKFGENVVLDGIDLTINKGDVIAIIGPSGTGKSTLLRCIDRLEKPEEGELIIDDLKVNLAQASKKELIDIRNGFSELESFFQENSIGKCNGRLNCCQKNG